MFRVRKRRSQSVLPGRFSVLKSCLLWVPQYICLGTYKACSKKFLCWGRPCPEFQKLAVEKEIHHLQDLYTCQFFAPPLQRQPDQGYKQTRHYSYKELRSLLPLHPTRAAYLQPMERASNLLVASDRSCRGVVVLKQTEYE